MIHQSSINSLGAARKLSLTKIRTIPVYTERGFLKKCKAVPFQNKKGTIFSFKIHISANLRVPFVVHMALASRLFLLDQNPVYVSSQHKKNLESGSMLIATELIAEGIRYDYEAEALTKL